MFAPRRHVGGVHPEPETSAAWALRIAVVLGAAASGVALTIVGGVSVVCAIALAICALLFVGSYILTPAPGRCQYELRDLNPILVMLGTVVTAIAFTGGIFSPLLLLLPGPFVVGWTLFPAQYKGRIAALVAVSLIVLIAVGASPTMSARTVLVLTVWSTSMSLWLMGRRLALMFETHRNTTTRLDLVRNGVLSDADSRRRGIESMTTKLAHELKNPLAAIKSLVQLELRTEADEKSQRRLEVVFGEAERMQTILRDYLELARPIDEMRVVMIDLEQLMEEVIALLAGRAEAAGVELRMRGMRGTIEADPRLLKEAIINLASNGLLATPRGGLVDLMYHVGATTASIVVRDTGVGMTREVSQRVGTPFFTTRDGGTGLGVAIARSAVAQHCGDLTYVSTPGMGTIATITIPADHARSKGLAA